MKISESAIQYFRENAISKIFIVPKVIINKYGSCCSVGSRNNIEAEVRSDLKEDETFQLYKYEDFEIFVKERILSAIDSDSDIDYKTGFFSNKKIVNNFHDKRIEIR